MRTAGRIIAGLFFGAMLFVGLAGTAHAQTGTTPTCPTGASAGTNPNCTTTTLPVTTTTAKATTTTAKASAATTLPHTGIDMWVPITVGGAALGLMIAARRVLRTTG